MRDDAAYLLDILLAAQKILEFTQSMSWEEFQQNEPIADAVTYRISIIGEAASKISQQTRDAQPEIRWKAMTGMRNRVIHEYFRVNLATVWDVVQKDIPA